MMRLMVRLKMLGTKIWKVLPFRKSLINLYWTPVGKCCCFYGAKMWSYILDKIQ